MDTHQDVLKRILDPEDNQTGGGAASALAAAMGAGLVGMVARLSVGRKAMPDPDEHYKEIDSRSQRLAQDLLLGAQADSQAFDAVMDAYRLPKTSPDERAARQQAIQEAMQLATQIPLDNAGRAHLVLDLCQMLRGRSNPNVASDLECAWYLARAGLLGCLSNAAINLESLREAADLVRLYESLRERTAALGDTF